MNSSCRLSCSARCLACRRSSSSSRRSTGRSCIIFAKPRRLPSSSNRGQRDILPKERIVLPLPPPLLRELPRPERQRQVFFQLSRLCIFVRVEDAVMLAHRLLRRAALHPMGGFVPGGDHAVRIHQEDGGVLHLFHQQAELGPTSCMGTQACDASSPDASGEPGWTFPSPPLRSCGSLSIAPTLELLHPLCRYTAATIPRYHRGAAGTQLPEGSAGDTVAVSNALEWTVGC